ncbi:lysophospholipase L1-like esterase [Sphingomonas jinjuensis]|uniref:Lysophospholipase L1-like esterase n=1 Tax=Sphingomonas jinjuensis TaxID=535907 RepID=A0A840F6J4_9SPHN|nr:SGNH/GDSL hydrolase family protein [Sphingomonas jinjuensis]MBB4152212.1 lysophospholipase L1-like esterase [Sphingomonas jinjuensis]
MTPRWWAAMLAVALIGTGASAQRWQSAWIAPPIGWEPASRKALTKPIERQTVAQVIRLDGEGARLRVRLTNELGMTPVEVGAASVALGGRLVSLSFGGAKGATIPAGAPLVSDPVALRATPGAELVLRVYYPGSVTPPAHAQMVRLTAGDTTASPADAGEEVRTAGLASAVEVDVAAPGKLLVAFGDSITEGAGASAAARTSWPAQLGALLHGAAATRCWSVVNAGISGNRLLHDGRGPNALARFDRDVLAVPGATHVVLLEGINDIGAGKDKPAEAVDADAVIGAYRQLIARAHGAGLRVIGGTLLPFTGAGYQTAAGEAMRLAINRWIRTSGAFDRVIDFEAATRDPAHPERLMAGYEIGDHLHPNDAGYTAMAKAARPVIAAEGCGRR